MENNNFFNQFFFLFLILGPAKWAELFPQARGQRQSPVDICSKVIKQSSDLTANPLRWRYIPEHTRSLVNPGT